MKRHEQKRTKDIVRNHTSEFCGLGRLTEDWRVSIKFLSSHRLGSPTSFPREDNCWCNLVLSSWSSRLSLAKIMHNSKTLGRVRKEKK